MASRKRKNEANDRDEDETPLSPKSPDFSEKGEKRKPKDDDSTDEDDESARKSRSQQRSQSPPSPTRSSQPTPSTKDANSQEAIDTIYSAAVSLFDTQHHRFARDAILSNHRLNLSRKFDFHPMFDSQNELHVNAVLQAAIDVALDDKPERITELILHHNGLAQLTGFKKINEKFPKLTHLDLSANLIQDLKELSSLPSIPKLTICLKENPVWDNPSLRGEEISKSFPHLELYDGNEVSLQLPKFSAASGAAANRSRIKFSARNRVATSLSSSSQPLSSLSSSAAPSSCFSGPVSPLIKLPALSSASSVSRPLKGLSPLAPTGSFGVSTAHENVINSMRKLINNPDTFPDVTFSVQDKTFHGHRAILGARCPKLLELFKGDPQKSVHNINSTSEAFLAFLEYCYAEELMTTEGSVLSLSSSLYISLLELTHQFPVDSLSRKCEDIIIRYISDDTVLDLLATAMKLKSDTIKKACFHHIIKFFTAISTQTKFRELDKDVLNEILMEAVVNMSPHYQQVERK